MKEWKTKVKMGRGRWREEKKTVAFEESESFGDSCSDSCGDSCGGVLAVSSCVPVVSEPVSPSNLSVLGEDFFCFQERICCTAVRFSLWKATCALS